MTRYLVTIFCLFVALTSYGQAEAVKQQAEQMGNALLKKDYKTFVTFSYPAILKQMGGADQMAANIQQQMSTMEGQGAKVVGLTYGTPSPFVKAGSELQCTIPQEMVVQMAQGKIASKSTLIAISPDQGKRWYFVDAGERDLATIRKSLSNISKSLVIPKPEPPKMLSR